MFGHTKTRQGEAVTGGVNCARVQAEGGFEPLRFCEVLKRQAVFSEWVGEVWRFVAEFFAVAPACFVQGGQHFCAGFVGNMVVGRGERGQRDIFVFGEFF